MDLMLIIPKYGTHNLLGESWLKRYRDLNLKYLATNIPFLFVFFFVFVFVFQGANSIIFYHETIPRALLDLFPNIGLDKSRFPAHCMFYLVFFFFSL